MNIASFGRKVRKQYATRGILGTIAFVPRFAMNMWRRIFPGRDEAQRRAVERAFDERYGTDTSGYIPAPDLRVKSSTGLHGSAYQGVNADTDFGRWLSPYVDNFEKYTFVDVGSGKGRAALLASRLPFRAVLGIEYSERLHEIALANRLRWPSSESRAAITFLCADAMEAPFPSGPLVMFMNNPFDESLMEKFAHLFVERPAPLLVVYLTPKHPAPWDAFLKRVDERPGLVIWQR